MINAILEPNYHTFQCGKQATGNKRPAGTRVVGGTAAKPGEWPWLAALGYRSKQVPMLLRKQCLSFYQISEIIPLCLEGWANKILVWRGSYWAKQCDHSGALYKIRPYNYPSGGAHSWN